MSSVGFLSILWIPVTGALLPALSSTHTSIGLEAVSEKLRPAFRLVNLTVLPLGAALGAVAPTALEVVYGPALASQAIPFALLTLTVIFSAQGAVLLTALQAIGNTKPLLKIFLGATILDLAAVSLTAKPLGPTSGAIGRVLLATGTLFLAWRSLRPTLDTPVTQNIHKAVLPATGTSIPLFVTDQFLTHTVLLGPILRLPAILVVFTASFLILSRKLSVFRDEDFAMLESTLPGALHPYVRTIQGLFM